MIHLDFHKHRIRAYVEAEQLSTDDIRQMVDDTIIRRQACLNEAMVQGALLEGRRQVLEDRRQVLKERGSLGRKG